VRERLLGQAEARRTRDLAARVADLRRDRVVVGRVAHDGDALVVLRRRAQHRRAADVDVLDGVGQADARLGDRLAERVEVHHDQVDGLDAVLGHLLLVVGDGPAEQAAMDARVQRLHAPVEDLGRAGVRGDGLDRDARVGERLGGAARGEDLDALLVQELDELEEAPLVGDRDDCPPDLRHGFVYQSEAGASRPISTQCAVGNRRGRWFALKVHGIRPTPFIPEPRSPRCPSPVAP
jgi:hypothetical protein